MCPTETFLFCLLLKNEKQFDLTDRDVIKIWFLVPVSSAWNLELSKDYMENQPLLKSVKLGYLQAQSQNNAKQNNLPIWRTFGSSEM